MIKEYITDFFSRLITPRMFFISMLVTLALISISIYRPLSEFYATDPSPGLIPILPQKKASGAESAVPVQVGMLILNFPEFDITANTFIADMTLWFEFDPSLITLETIEKFSFDQATILNKSDADMKITGDKLFVQYGIRLSFSSPLDYQLFPLNDHRLYITLKNEFVSPSELMFNAPRSSFLLGPNAHVSDWNLFDRATQTGYFQSNLDEFDPDKRVEYPAVVFSIDLEEKGIRKMFIVMLPMFILFLIAALTFLIKPINGLARSILSLSTGTLTGLIAYRFVIEKVVPDVGYFTLTDHIFNLFLVVIFAIFAINIMRVTMDRDDPTMWAIQGATLLCCQIIMVITFFYLLRIS